ncbi:SWI/SNF-related matrix-associated actin-dependent regulator of chromatin subfamily A-like protein 1 [Haliotis cracherodii]|uniref:SWI/SNF-related matrix-associated actin-dependent regulator of chromatin subfamily A-like protein 1 n=1 Tax=Haliotis cracherodii TaxID=6455 RepID=UPI0039E81839
MEKGGLTDEQRRKIEENRKRALERRQQKSPQKASLPVQTVTTNKIINPPSQFPGNKGQINSFGLTTVGSIGTNSHQHSSKPPSSSLGSIGSEKSFQNNRFQQYSYSHASGQNKSSGWKNTRTNSSGKTSSLYTSGHKQDPVSAKVFYSQNTVKGQCVLESRERFRVDIGYHAGLVEIFKSLNSKLYDAVSRKWSFKLEDYDSLLKAVTPLKPQVHLEPLPRGILQTFAKQLRGTYESNDIPDADLSKVDAVLVDALMPFQRLGVSFAIHKQGRVLLADDMGLGKTIQAICVAAYYRHLWPLLVVSPSSVRFDWAQQIRRWIPSLDPQEINVVVSGKSSCTSGQVNIVSYDILARKAEDVKKKHFQVVIMDECHFLKNFKTVRTKAALPILQNARKVLLLSGTPALSRPSELYTQIVAVVPSLFKFHDFGVRYCDGKQQPWGWDFSGASNMAELQLLLEERIMIRRQKKDVLSQLPAKVRQMVLLDPQSIKSNKDLKNSSKLLDHKNLKGMERRGALLEYFHHTCTAKTKAVRDYILDMLESDKKFIVFAHHQEMLDAVEDAIVSCKNGPEFIRIDGKTSSEERNIRCQRFQNSESVKAAVLSITAANAGLNMAAATVVVFAELFWNPGILVQAEDRAHRIGQMDCVNVHYLVAQATADDYIWPLIQSKLEVLSKAGLTKDNFSEADTTHMKDSRSKDIMDYFEDSFIEEGEVEGDKPDEEPTKPSTSISPAISPDKQEKRAAHTARQSNIDKFFVTKSEDKASQDSKTQDEDFDSDDFFDTLTSEDMLALTDDVNWDEEIHEPDLKKRKL